MHCHIVTDLDRDEAGRIDSFLAGGPATAHMQRIIWPEVAKISRLQHYRYLVCEEDGGIVLAAVIRFTALFPGLFLAVMPGGPVVHDISVFSRCLPTVKKTLQQAGAVTVVVNPIWAEDDADAVSAALVDNGFEELPNDNRAMYRITGYVDLQQSEDQIFTGLKYSCRKAIRRAAELGLTVRSARDEDDVLRLQALCEEFFGRKKLEVAGAPDLVDQLRYVESTGGVFHLAEVDGHLVGGHVAFGEGRRAVSKTLASLPMLPNLPRNHNLLWEAIRSLKAQGFTEFDIGGLSERVTREGKYEGRDLFKMAFKPRVVRLVPTYAAPLRPVGHAVLFRGRQWYRRSSFVRCLGPLLNRRRRRA